MTPGTHHPYRPQTKPFNSNHQLKIKNHLAQYFFRPSGPQPFQPDPQFKTSTLEQTGPGTRLPGSGTPIKQKTEKQKKKQKHNKNKIENPPHPLTMSFVSLQGCAKAVFEYVTGVLAFEARNTCNVCLFGPPQSHFQSNRFFLTIL